jgi:hypothetical protein
VKHALHRTAIGVLSDRQFAAKNIPCDQALLHEAGAAIRCRLPVQPPIPNH